MKTKIKPMSTFDSVVLTHVEQRERVQRDFQIGKMIWHPRDECVVDWLRRPRRGAGSDIWASYNFGAMARQSLKPT